MISVKANYSILDELERETDRYTTDEIIKRLTNIGELYIAEARQNGSYTDQTGSLRNAHSYIIYHNGERVAGAIGRTETLNMFEQFKKNEGWQFITGDGMNYASCVEGRGYDVCTYAFMLVEQLVSENFKRA
jgi:hypothetical protein